MGNCVSQNSKLPFELDIDYDPGNGSSHRDSNAQPAHKQASSIQRNGTIGKKNKAVQANSREFVRVIGDRKFHNFQDVHYYLPCDNEETDRLSNEHFLVKNLWGRNFFSPIENLLLQGNIKILDVGCGSGTWMLEMATLFPSSFYGIDISRMYPSAIKPRNTEFINANILRGLPFGGFLEFVESDIECINAGPLLRKLTNEFISFLETKGITLKPIDIGSLLATRDVKNIQHLQQIIPMGKRAGALGILAAENQHQIWRSLQSTFINYSKEEYIRMIDNIFSTE
ncbi:13497_t:CDS:2, partial [Ambispora leptoticha]